MSIQRNTSPLFGVRVGFCWFTGLPVRKTDVPMEMITVEHLVAKRSKYFNLFLHKRENLVICSGAVNQIIGNAPFFLKLTFRARIIKFMKTHDVNMITRDDLKTIWKRMIVNYCFLSPRGNLIPVWEFRVHQVDEIPLDILEMLCKIERNEKKAISEFFKVSL